MKMRTDNITPPRHYDEWMALLERLRKKDRNDEVLNAIKSGGIQWEEWSIIGYSTRLLEVAGKRLAGSIRALVNEFPEIQERELYQALKSIRQEFQLFISVANASKLPTQCRNTCQNTIINLSHEIQSAVINDTIKADRTGRLTSFFRNNRIDDFDYSCIHK